MTRSIHNFKRVVLKIGSSLLTEEASGTVRAEWLGTLAADIARLRAMGKEIIIVTSGAVALGRGVLTIHHKPLKLEEKQAAAACGQPLIMQAWREALASHRIATAQLLLTIDDSENRRRYLNARNTLETLLERGVVPVINENDTVATAELRFGDNDRLAARVAQMASAELLVIFSDIDGLYTANPHTDPTAVFIPELHEITPAIEQMAGGSSSTVGTGGMVTKLAAAKIALSAGCHMLIARGSGAHPLAQLEQPGARGTWCVASATPLSARKHWIGGALKPIGTLVVDAGAAQALLNGKSLLPAGVTRVEGTFERGDAVWIAEASGRVLGKGLSAYSSADAERIRGRKSDAIEAILGFKGRDTLVHRDDLALEIAAAPAATGG